MPRFYVHIDDDEGRTIDEEGHEARDLDEVLRLARDTAAEIIHHEVMAGQSIVNLTLRIEDATHRELLSLPVTATVPR